MCGDTAFCAFVASGCCFPAGVAIAEISCQPEPAGSSYNCRLWSQCRLGSLCCVYHKPENQLIVRMRTEVADDISSDERVSVSTRILG